MNCARIRWWARRIGLPFRQRLGTIGALPVWVARLSYTMPFEKETS